MAEEDKNKITEEFKLNTMNEFNLFANDYETWHDQWQDSDYAEEILREKLHRLNGNTDHLAISGENDATDIVSQSMENIINKPKNQRTKADYALLKAPIRGAATIWNGIVFLGREAWDYENWIKSYERIKAGVDGDPNTDFWKKGKLEDWAERTKRSGIRRNKDGFWENWGRAVSSREEYAKAGIDPKFIEGSNEWSDWMFDEIPFENEDLGYMGNAVEILTHEVLTMGPLAVLKLRKASKVADWFAMKAGAKTQGGKYVKGKDGVEKLINKEGQDAVSHIDILSPSYKGRGMKGEMMDEKLAMKYDKALKIARQEGSFGKVLGMKGTNAFAEAEIMTSISVAAAGATMQEMFGRGYSVIGEVGAGLAGARPLVWAGRYGMDWMNWFRYSANPLKSKKAKDDAFMRMMGFDIRPDGTVVDPNKIIGKNSDGSNLYATVPQGKLNALQKLAMSRPGFPLLLGVGKGETRKKLAAYRTLGDQLMEMPSDIREEFIKRIGAIDTLISKYDDNGRLYATIAQAINLDVFATIQARALANATLGKRVRVKMDVDQVRLQDRMSEASQALQDMLTQFPDELWKDASFRNLIKGFQNQIDATTRRLEQVDYKNIKNYKMALKEKAKTITKKQSDGKALGEDVFELSVTKDDKLRTGRQIDSTSDINTSLLVDETDEALINKIWEEEGFYEVAMKDSAGNILRDNLGKPITRMYNKRNTALDRNVIDFENDSRKLVDDAFNADKTAGSKLYKDLDKQTDNSYSGKNLGTINARAASHITADLGAAVEKGLEGVGMEMRPIIHVNNKDVQLKSYLITKRREALDQIADEDVLRIYDEMADDAVRQGKEGFPTRGKITDDANRTIDEAIDDADDVRDALSKQVEMALPDEVAKNLNITLKDLVGIRSSLYKFATGAYRQKDKLSGNQGIDAFLQFSVANRLSDSLNKFGDDDLIKGWKAANDNWKINVGDKWSKGLAQKLIAVDARGNKVTGAGKIFDSFINSTGDYKSAVEVFRSIFRSVDGDTSINQNAINLLDEALLRRARKAKSNDMGVDSDFWEAGFGDKDILNLGTENTAEFQRIANDRYKTPSTGLDGVNTKLTPIEEKLQNAIDVHESSLQHAAKNKYGFSDLGVTLDEMQKLAGVTNEAAFRKAVLDGTYRGGNPELARAVWRKVKGNKKAEEGFFRMLYDGAVEDAVAKSGEGKGFRYDSATGQFQGNLQVSANAFQEYLAKTETILKEAFDTDTAKLTDGSTIFERMEEMGSVLQLVGGEVNKATMEGLPKSFRVEQIISRLYSIARGVVSPRYVMTELLIQDARFRRGKLLEQIATDPDAALILSEVISKNGLKNIQVRKDFTNWFVEGMIRVARGDDPTGPGSKLAQYYIAKDKASDVNESVDFPGFDFPVLGE